MAASDGSCETVWSAATGRRIDQSSVRWPSSIMPSTSEVVPVLSSARDVEVVGVADDDVQAPVAVGDGVRLVAGVDDRALEGRLEPDLGLEEVGALGDLVARSPAVDAEPDPAGAADDLARHEERDEAADDVGEGRAPGHEVVLVGAVGLALAVGVVLVEVDRRLAGARGEQSHRLERDGVTGAVPGDGVARQGHLGRAVLGVGVVDVVAGAVGEHDVGERRVLDVGELARVGGLPVELPAAGVAQRVLERVVPARLVGADPLGGGIHADDLAREEHRVGHRVAGHRDAVLGLEPHDPPHRHGPTITAPAAAPRRVRHQPIAYAVGAAARWPRPSAAG